MKKKVFSFLTFIIVMFVCSASIAQGSASSYKKTSDKDQAFNIDAEVSISVGQEIVFEDYYMPYVGNDTEFTYTVENKEIVYVTTSLNKLIGLKAGSSVVKAESEEFYSEFTVNVKLEDMNPDSGFDYLTRGSQWTEPNQNIDGWTLYTGGSSVASDQIVELYTDEENNSMIHFNHPGKYYANLYKDLKGLPGGQYYVTADMKGENVSSNNCFIRLNLNSIYGSTQTTRLEGTFDWGTFTSPVFRVEDGANLRLELYFANNSGEVWFDDIHVYRVITLDHTSFVVENSVEKLTVGNQTQIVCETIPASNVDFDYVYESLDTSIATVTKTGIINAHSNGVTTIKVTDVLGGYVRNVLVIVGVENGITAVVNNGEKIMVTEDSTNQLAVSSETSTNYTVYKYSEPLHGDYYIKDNKIIYSPAADYYTNGDNVDQFKVVVSDSHLGFTTLDVEVTILPKDDAVNVIDYWHSVEKNGVLEWTTEKNGKYDHHINDANYANGLYGGGYIQVQSYDVEVLYPEIKRNNMGANSTEQQAYRDNKGALYSKIIGTALDGSLTITSKNGGTVEILYDGKAQEIEDRYYSSQTKIIHGIIYNYTPAKNFVGYDTFEMKITNGEESVVFENTVYVLPDVVDFNFNDLNFNGVYLLSNSAWLEEVYEGYVNGDEYINTWIKYYAAEYSVFVPSGVPATSRTALEQLAIMYKVTGEQKYFDMCWEQLEAVVKDEEYSGDGTARLSWGGASNGFLDAAMVTYSVGFAYNYLKDDLSAEQKEIVLKALYEEGFYYFETLDNVNVLLHGNNHNLLVCGNLAVAALSVMSFEGDLDVTVGNESYTINVREMAAEVVTTAFKYLQIGLVHYSESGGFPEGPSYSIYAHRNMVNLLATLYNLYGTDENGNINSFGLSSIKGITDYINYPLYTSTPNYESFYYAESEYSNNQPALLWYTRIDDENINAAVLPLLAHQNEQYNIQNLLWYKPGLFEKVDLHNMEEKDMLLEGHELATFRSEFGDEMAVFTGLKGVNDYTNNYSHKNLDSGTFEIYALGERFIGNYSNETYNTVVPDGYWDYDYQRWTYYKKNAQGQNTLVINPDQNPVLTQDPYENAPITRFESNDTSGISVIDLSRVYKSEALSVQRGLRLFNNRQYVMIQDEFKLRSTSTLYWSAHTEARVDIINDKLARLTLNNKSIYVLIVSELGAFQKMSGNTPLPGTIGEFCNLDNDGITKLVIELNDIIDGTLSVVFIPTLEEISNFENYEVKPIESWVLDDSKVLPDITADDITFDLDVNKDLGQGYKYKFNPYQYSYLVKLGKNATNVPNFVVKYDEAKYDLKINKSNLFNNLTTVTLTDKTTGESRTYLYKFVADVITNASEYANYTELDVVSVSGHNNANLLIDGDNKTALNSNQKEEIIFELKDINKLTSLLIRFDGGVRNTYYFDVYYSEDGVTYKSAYFAGQSFNNIGDEIYTLGHVNAKYIKIVFYGNNNDDAVKVSEVRFFDNGSENNLVPNKPTNNNNIIIYSIVGSVCGLAAIAGVVTFIILKRRKKENV